MSSSLCFWVIFAGPRDFPSHIVIRRQYGSYEGVSYAPIACLYDNIDQARRDIPRQCCCLPRSLLDDPAIVETWF